MDGNATCSEQAVKQTSSKRFVFIVINPKKGVSEASLDQAIMQWSNRIEMLSDSSIEDRFNPLCFAIRWAQFFVRPHGSQHGVVDIDSLLTEVDDLTGLEATTGGGDRVEYARELTFHIGVATISRFGRNRDAAVLQDRVAVGLGGLVEPF